MTVANVTGDTTSGDGGLRRHARNPDAHHPRRHLLYGTDHLDVDLSWDLFEGAVLSWSESLGKFVLRAGTGLSELGSIDGGFAASTYFGGSLVISGGDAETDFMPLDCGGADTSYFPTALVALNVLDGGSAESVYNLSVLVECGSAASEYAEGQELIGGYA